MRENQHHHHHRRIIGDTSRLLLLLRGITIVAIIAMMKGVTATATATENIVTITVDIGMMTIVTAVIGMMTIVTADTERGRTMRTGTAEDADVIARNLLLLLLLLLLYNPIPIGHHHLLDLVRFIFLHLPLLPLLLLLIVLIPQSQPLPSIMIINSCSSNRIQYLILLPHRHWRERRSEDVRVGTLLLSLQH